MQNFTDQQIDRYHILEPLGEGGMAVVYKAYDTRLERDVAIKFIRIEGVSQERDDRIILRFQREARAMAKLVHSHIVQVMDYGEFEGTPYLVMPYLSGGTLKSLTGSPMPYQQAASLLAPIADALAYAHSQGIIHRDIKPANILITKSGTPMLSDFGIAKLLEEQDVTLTSTGFGVGTPHYMAPEQVDNKVVPQTDIYALGTIFYELVTGKKPYDAETPAAILVKRATEPLVRPRTFISNLPEDVEKIIFKAMAYRPENRYERMAQFHNVLYALASGQSVPVPETPDWEQPNPERSSELEGTEGTTRDLLEPSPPPIADVPGKPTAEKKRSIPKWAYWVGAGVSLVAIVCVITGIALKDIFPGRETESASPAVSNEIASPTDAPTLSDGLSFTQSPEIVYSTEVTSSPTNQTTVRTTTPGQEFTQALPFNIITPTAIIYNPLSGCAASQIHLGDSAFISYDTGRNFLREEPDTNPIDNIIGEIQPGEVVIIIDGPVCNYGWLLWKVQTSRNEMGWTPESNGSEFWVLPLTTRDLCTGALPSRLVVGGTAKVMEEPDKANWVREEPGDNETFIGKIYPGEWMEIIDGPYCGGNTTWWKVKAINSGLTGWTMEGNSENYYLVPAP